jgi:sarcosine oxidase subunit beta
VTGFHAFVMDCMPLPLRGRLSRCVSVKGLRILREPVSDVVIVGGGVTGLSAGLHLKKLGVPRVRLLERHHLGSGQSGHAAGVVRALVGHQSVACMLMESLRFFTSFKEHYGEELGVHRTGYLLLNESDQSDNLEQVIEKARAAGCGADRVSAADALELQPGLRENSQDIFAFEPAAIHVDPMATVQALARVARRLGLEIVEGCEVHSILKNGSQIQGVETRQGKVEAGKVLVATAVWGAPQLAQLGIDVPVYPHRAEMAFFAVGPQSPGRLVRILSDPRTMVYLRPEGTDLMFVGWREGDNMSSTKDFVAADPDNYWQSSNYVRLQEMHRGLSDLLPFMSHGYVQRTYACVYDYTPDGMPILDGTESLQGLYFSLGYSGGGFSLSPWVGASMAQFIAEGRKSPEMELLRLSRFRDGKFVRWGNTKKGLH